MSHPNTIRITSLAGWTRFFHPTTGLLRSGAGSASSVDSPAAAAAAAHIDADTIEHLDIDLRFVDHEAHEYGNATSVAETFHPVNLPRVCVLTLRGGEFVQDCEERMDCLGEVLDAISPIEVRWLNAYDEVNEQQTMSTVMVHPTIILAGEIWRSRGSLRKLVIQGGFPVPNLTAPTPFSLTPAGTPATSPGPHKLTFGAFPGFGNTGLPSLSAVKPKIKDAHADDDRAKARAERKRLAEYELKPRWEWAFGSWGVHELWWTFAGRYSPAAVSKVMSLFVECLDKTYPSTTHKAFLDPPALCAFAHVPETIMNDVSAALVAVQNQAVAAYMADTAFVSTCGTTFARLVDVDVNVKAEARAGDQPDRARQSKRLKAEMMLLQHSDVVIVGADGEVVAPAQEQEQSVDLGSPTGSMQSLVPADQDVSASEDGDEDEARTPPLGSSIHFTPPQAKGQTQAGAGKAETVAGDEEVLSERVF